MEFSILRVFFELPSHSCIGRLFIGTAGDRLQTQYGIQQVWCLLLVAATFLLSQTVASSTDGFSGLAISTVLVGFGYGQFYGLMAPTIL